MFEHVWEEHGLVRRFHGHLSAEEIERSGVIAQADRRFDSLRYVINDCRGCTSVSAAPQVIEEIAATDAAAALTNDRIRIAVVSDDPAVLAITDTYRKARYSPFPIRNFSTMEAAREWLAEKRQA